MLTTLRRLFRHHTAAAPTYCAPCGWWHEPPIHG